MTITHNTQSTPHPPKQPLFLSPDEIRAYYDIDRNGIDKASSDSRMKLEFLVACLTTETVNFLKTYPHTQPAGLLLTIDVLLPVYEPVDEDELMSSDDDEHQGEGL